MAIRGFEKFNLQIFSEQENRSAEIPKYVYVLSNTFDFENLKA